MLQKTLRFEPAVLDVLQAMRWDEDGKVGVITSQLDRGLYVQVNKALEAMGGKWNRKAGGHTFPHDPRPSVDGLLASGTLTVERDGFFQTPKAVVERMIYAVGIPSGAEILEPSAGLGAIAQVLVEHGADVSDMLLIEKNEDRCVALRSQGFRVMWGDFLTMTNAGGYDRVFMNPPFEEGQDMRHVRHAFSFLAKGGQLAAIMSEGPFFREDQKAWDFRGWLARVGGISVRLEDHSFRASGTDVATRLVVIEKKG